MTEEQQINELEQLITHIFLDACLANLDRAEMLEYMAHSLYKEGYRKQSEGEWVYIKSKGDICCSECSNPACSDECEYHLGSYCLHCGARMKVGEQYAQL